MKDSLTILFLIILPTALTSVVTKHKYRCIKLGLIGIIYFRFCRSGDLGACILMVTRTSRLFAICCLKFPSSLAFWELSDYVVACPLNVVATMALRVEGIAMPTTARANKLSLKLHRRIFVHFAPWAALPPGLGARAPWASRRLA